MAKKVFIGATGQNCGKTTLSVSLMHLAREKYERVGFMKPIGPKGEMYHDLLVDKDAVLMAKTFGLEEDIALMSPVAMDKDFTRNFLNGRISPQYLIDRIGNAMHEMEKKYDVIIIEGAGHGGVGAVVKLNNARVAHLLDAPVVIISESGIGSVIDSVELNLALYEREKADVRLVLVNKLISKKRDSIISFLRKGLETDRLGVIPGFNYSRTLANPTLSHVAQLFKLPLRGEASESSRIIHNIQLGAASSQRVVDSLLDSTLLITTSSRDELIVTLASLYNIPSYKNLIAGLVIAGHVPVSKISQQILDDSNVPYVRVEETTSLVYSTIADDVAKITAEDQEKINWITAHAGEIDFETIEQALW